MIRKRRDGLQVQVYAGRDPLTGRKRYVSQQVPGRTKAAMREAKQVEARLLEEVGAGRHKGSPTRTVGELLKQAVVWAWIGHNPAKLATPPAVEKADVRPPQAEDAARLLRGAMEDDSELGLFLRLAVVLGARRASCAACDGPTSTWTSEILIAGGIVRVHGQPLIDKDTKTHAKRRVAVGAGTLGLLKAHRVEQAKTALACGVTPAADAYVFSHAPDAGAPLDPDGVSHRFGKLARHLGVRCRLHDLRHFMVTQLVAGGVDWRTVSGRAGHADGHMTLATYAHFQAAQDRQAAELMERLPGRAGLGWGACHHAARRPWHALAARPRGRPSGPAHHAGGPRA